MRANHDNPAPELKPPSFTATERWVCVVSGSLALIGILNFGCLLAQSMVLGGTADRNGYFDGQYHVSEHGKYTVVSKATYDGSRRQALSVLVTHPVALLSLIVFGGMMEQRKRRLASS